MSEDVSEAEIYHLRQLMSGSGDDRYDAANLLKNYDPYDLPEDILEVWTRGSSDNRYSANQVVEHWQSKRHKGRRGSRRRD